MLYFSPRKAGKRTRQVLIHKNVNEEGFSILFDMRLTGDYSDRFDLTEEDVTPNIQPTEDFVVKVSDLAKEKLGLK